MVELDSYDKKILRLLKHPKYIIYPEYSVQQIAKNTEMSWATANIHLDKLKQMGFIIKEKIKGLATWKLRI